MAFADRLSDFPVVLEIVPPNRRASDATVRRFIRRVQETMRAIPHLDALNLPEIVDENHTGQPFYRTMNPRRFAGLLNVRFEAEVVVNKVVVHMAGAAEFDAWAKECLDAYGLRNFVLVGGSSRHIAYPGLPVVEANARLRELAGSYGNVSCGNVTIPERAGEVERMLAKTRAGCRFFTTQVLFAPEPVSGVLERYGGACAAEGLEPATVLLSFAPVAEYQDIEFLAWLGASVLPETEERLLSAKRPGPASLEIAREIYVAIRDRVAASDHPVPLGVNVEEISQHNFDLAVRMAKSFPAWRDADD